MRGSRNHELLHWLPYAKFTLRCVEVVLIAVAALVFAIVADKWKESTAKEAVDYLRQQTENQNRSSQAELAASLLPYMKCDNLWPMTYNILKSGAPKYAVDADNFRAGCPLTPTERTQVAKLRMDAQLTEIRLSFLDQLSAAREYHHVGLDSDAASEYAQAYNVLPSEFSELVDTGAAERGRLALNDGRFREAVDDFVLAFAKIPTP